MVATEVDAIVIGSGINGMVAAAELGRAGWSVALLERNEEIGGFIASSELTAPGYIHDTYSSWHPLFLSSPAYGVLGEDLARHGLEYRNTDELMTASVADDGAVSLAYRDPDLTAGEFTKAEDGQAYLEALQQFGCNAKHFGALMGTELRRPAVAALLARFLKTNGRRGAEAWMRDMATSGRSYCSRTFQGHEVDHLWAPWLLHAGLSPDHAAGGLMIPVFAATLHGFGLPVVAGGSANLIRAFRGIFAETGVQVHTGAEAERIVVDSGRAVAVETADQRIRARRAILASVTPTALYGSLLPERASTPDLRRQAAAYRYGRAEMQVHVALSAPPKWRDPRLNRVPLVHISDGSASTGIACAEAEAGLLPQRPTVVVGQQFLLDPSRVPHGAGALWLQLQEVPFTPRGDARGQLDTTAGWTADLARDFAQRALDRVAAHTEGLAGQVLDVHVVTPRDLHAYNVNAVAGDPYGGNCELDQSFVWRPLPGSGRHRTNVKSLWHIGASTHPGAGLGAGSGHLVASALTARSRSTFN
ncbi:NAD(P)/FAD-dependent oxidoreductase [Hoyosella sp. YIM 151337]|uniref:phytoene desaturase family protein n=1 Tax=Hoyosella sp. YIM 151337 TaxID=2992742 RepID=UPI0022362863|nr:NAD(P)/FAD-dependent oxidoreductase [Hoyosella sp. YIM 151337]MCW4354672.1 NAD(P)/FAD-dependent oxidoreductase [Hoyosella sp. YIM 151337]